LGPLLVARLRFTTNAFIYIGLTLLMGGFFGTALLFYYGQQPFWATHITLFMAGLGHGTMMPVMMRTAIALVPKDKAGQASALVSISMQIGGVTGGAIIGTLFFSLIATVGFPKAFALAIATIALFQTISLFINGRLFELRNNAFNTIDK